MIQKIIMVIFLILKPFEIKVCNERTEKKAQKSLFKGDAPVVVSWLS